jgi:hypothetical protein
LAAVPGPRRRLAQQRVPAGLPATAMESTFFADRACEFFRSHCETPFALVVGFYDPHAPFRFPREWAGRYRPRDFAVPEVSEADRREQPNVFKALTHLLQWNRNLFHSIRLRHFPRLT